MASKKLSASMAAAVRSDKCKLLEEEWRLVEGGDSDCSLVDDDDELGAKSEGH